MKREAQTIEDKWEMRKAILAKEALIESVCSTTKVSWREKGDFLIHLALLDRMLEVLPVESFRIAFDHPVDKMYNLHRTGRQLQEERTPVRMAQLLGR